MKVLRNVLLATVGAFLLAGCTSGDGYKGVTVRYIVPNRAAAAERDAVDYCASYGLKAKKVSEEKGDDALFFHLVTMKYTCNY